MDCCDEGRAMKPRLRKIPQGESEIAWVCMGAGMMRFGRSEAHAFNRWRDARPWWCRWLVKRAKPSGWKPNRPLPEAPAPARIEPSEPWPRG